MGHTDYRHYSALPLRHESSPAQHVHGYAPLQFYFPKQALGPQVVVCQRRTTSAAYVLLNEGSTVSKLGKCQSEMSFLTAGLLRVFTK